MGRSAVVWDSSQLRSRVSDGSPFWLNAHWHCYLNTQRSSGGSTNGVSRSRWRSWLSYPRDVEIEAGRGSFASRLGWGAVDLRLGIGTERLEPGLGTPR